MSLVEHTNRELELLEAEGEDSDYIASLRTAVAGFTSYDGHSGASLLLAVDQLSALIRQEALTPLTSDPAEWRDASPESGYPIWQNRRDSRAFSKDGGKTWRMMTGKSSADDPWRVEEFLALPDVCFVLPCTNDDIDVRGPVWLRDGKIAKACVEHWEGIMGVLGQQATWERDDGARSTASSPDQPST